MDSHEVRREWAERTGEYSPAYYAYYGPNDTSESIRGVLDRFVGRDASVLELGCSSGRHLAHLREHGYEDLNGIEVNEAAFDVMEETYPELADDGTFFCDAMEDVVETFEDGQFDAVFSVQTLQHVHPEAAWVYEELVRVAGDLLVTVEIESGSDSDADADADADSDADADVNFVDEALPLYYRNWKRIFTALGFEQIDTWSAGRDTARVFRDAPEASDR